MSVGALDERLTVRPGEGFESSVDGMVTSVTFQTAYRVFPPFSLC